MKTRSIALAAAQAAGSTTLAWCWKAVRKDGLTLCVTTCARDLLFEGFLYRSKDGFNPKGISQEASAAVVNTEVEGFLSEEITELEFEAGKWDGCAVEMFEVNYRDLSMGMMRLASFTLGDITVDRGTFNAEVRGLTEALQKQVGRTVTKGCPWRFGSIGDAYKPACNKPLAPLAVTGTLTNVSDLRSFSDSSRAEATDYFGGGLITFLTGANAGVSMEIYGFEAGAFVLHLPMTAQVAVGDTYTVTPGCRKRYTEDCRNKWANINNFGGFPLIPGPDQTFGLGGTEGSNL